MYRIFFVIILYVAILFSCSGCNNSDSNEPLQNISSTPQVDVYVVESQTVPLIRKLPGRTVAFNVAEVRPQVNGIILKRKFKEGSLVQEGEELYEINNEVYQAHFDKVLAHLNCSERELQRAEKLKENRAISEQEYEDILYTLETAKADVELARLNLNYCKVNAPLHGKIGRSMISVGALVTNGQAQELAVIHQIDPIYVDLNPAVSQILQTQNSQNGNENRLPFWQDAEVTLTLEDGSQYPFQGKIKFLDNHVQKDTGTVLLRAEVPNPNGILLPGMFIRTSVVEGVRYNGKLIPQQALFRNAKGSPYVWIVRPDNTVEIRHVQVERMFGNTWLIDTGIEEGERIVVEGTQFLGQGVKVIPRNVEHLELKTSFDQSESSGK
ncbi:MAG: efflux RND transporter periplasmic adaptor subunit [Planctomycetaceae bacterium]|nr:efflux RND transporter periplasmic adaptor subunit [Planctomycetaceae bacterium]